MCKSVDKPDVKFLEKSVFQILKLISDLVIYGKYRFANLVFIGY